MQAAQDIWAWIGLVVSIGNAAAALLPEAGPVRLPLCLAFACLGPGCATLAHARVDDAATAWALGLGLSLAVVALVSAVLAWTGWWHPAAGSAVLAAACAASCVAGLARGGAVVVR
jgi:hypothetical protein